MSPSILENLVLNGLEGMPYIKLLNSLSTVNLRPSKPTVTPSYTAIWGYTLKPLLFVFQLMHGRIHSDFIEPDESDSDDSDDEDHDNADRLAQRHYPSIRGLILLNLHPY